MQDIAWLIRSLPKAELHIHIEGTLEPKLMLKFAKRNNVPLKYKSVKEIKDAYQFKNLQDFLNIYYAGTRTLQTTEDFYELMWNYLKKAHEENVIRSEIFFDPQAHMRRGVKFHTFMDGFISAIEDAKRKFRGSYALILSFLRDLPEDDALKTLEDATPYLSEILGVGLDSAELNNPPSKFKRVFSKAQDMGLLRVAHAGEEGPAEYIWDAIENLRVQRIDHGVRAEEDPKLMDFLSQNKIPLTMCPLSNLKLKVVQSLSDYPLKKFLRRGILATVNSDDPAYFGGYVNDNYLAVQRALNLTHEEICTLARNSIDASFISSDRKLEIFQRIDEVCRAADELDELK